jgi:mono/diheme cytochrome c family protein
VDAPLLRLAAKRRRERDFPQRSKDRCGTGLELGVTITSIERGREGAIHMATNMMKVSLVLVVGGLAACAEPYRRPPEITTGAAGTGAIRVPDQSFPTGAAGTGAACGPDGKPFPMPLSPTGGAFMLALPAVPTKAEKPLPAISGGTLLTLADGKTAVASDPDRDRVYVVDLEGTLKVRATVLLSAGDEPGRVIEDGAKRVHVALRGGGAVVTIDPATGTLGERRAVCAAPRGIAYQATGDLLHVACASGELVSLPAAGGAITRTLKIERDLRDVVVSVNDGLLVSTFRRADIIEVTKDGVLGRRMKPGSGMAMSFVSGPRHMSPSVAWRMVPLADAAGSVVMLHQTGVDSEVIPAGGGYGGIKGCSAIVEAGVSILTPGGEPPALASGFDFVSLAVDVAVSPDKSRFALAVPANASTPFATVVTGNMTSAASTPVGQGPVMPGCTSLSGLPMGSPPQEEVVAVSFMTDTIVLAQTRDPAMLWRSDTGERVALSLEARADTGHQLFHANAGGGLACASCHPEGGEDGRTWTFACMGARRTQSIRGGIRDTAPFHWAGDETDFSKLMDDVFVQRMSGPQLMPTFKDALANWIETIPALPKTAGLDAAAVARGKAVFEDAKVACSSCHAGGLMTNNVTVEVGTGLPLQVPSLRGLSWRAPFMHDGCAARLGDRFSIAACGGGDKHGVTSHLMPTQIADLTTYLESL